MLLAITWNSDRVLLLTARGGGTLQVERAITADIEKGSNVSVYDTIRKTIQTEQLTKCDTIIVLPRSEVEVRQMSFPYVPVDEIPDMARFQAAREFNSYDVASPLDYLLFDEISVPLGYSTTSLPVLGRRILASMIPSSQMTKLTTLCDACKLRLKRIVLRPSEVTALWRRNSNFDSSQTYLLVELDSEVVSQTVIHHGQPIFMRSPRLPLGVFRDDAEVDDGDATDSMIAELKRTQFAVSNEVQPVTIGSIVLCGTTEKHKQIADDIHAALSVSVALFDPWSTIKHGKITSETLPHSEQYAALIGVLNEVAANKPSDIDLLNPKRPPEKVGKRQLVTLVSGVAIVLLFAALAYGYVRRVSLENELKDLQNRVTQLKEEEKVTKKLRTDLSAIDTWAADRIDWFEQLEWLSQHLPKSEDIVLTDMTLRAAGGTGNIDIKGNAKNADVFSSMETSLSGDTFHRIRSGDKRKEAGNGRYEFRFDNMSVIYQPNASVAANTKVPAAPVNKDNSADNNSSPDRSSPSGSEVIQDKSSDKNNALTDGEEKNINAGKANEGAGK
ncbi:MAG: hypothetical protein LBU65_05715 [Planctomycetaceae bacterium]|jgi:Tfp pilus assembly protein PilN|nr:hypothetical protein [Planctomycetaceae bacterium]